MFFGGLRFSLSLLFSPQYLSLVYSPDLIWRGISWETVFNISVFCFNYYTDFYRDIISLQRLKEVWFFSCVFFVRFHFLDSSFGDQIRVTAGGVMCSFPFLSFWVHFHFLLLRSRLVLSFWFRVRRDWYGMDRCK